jgi:hypothetical protein
MRSRRAEQARARYWCQGATVARIAPTIVDYVIGQHQKQSRARRQDRGLVALEAEADRASYTWIVH